MTSEELAAHLVRQLKAQSPTIRETSLSSFVQILLRLTSGEVPEELARTKLLEIPEIETILNDLVGKEFTHPRSVISFNNSQTGDATINGDVAGSNVFKISLSLQQLDNQYKVHGLPNPFLGLRPFTYHERKLFAGRERQVEAAVRVLTNPGYEQEILFVTGTSGSGKSSFVQAGVMPALEKHYIDANMSVAISVVQAGRIPFTNIERKTGISALIANRQKTVITTKQPVLLLLIDQFEEVFTQSEPEEVSKLFALLENWPTFTEVPTHVMITLRSDYLPELFNHKYLYEQAKKGVDLRVMRSEEIRDAIQHPLHAIAPSKSFEPGLLVKLANDASGDAAYLPLLQVTLESLWRQGELVLSNYKTLTDAIRERAEIVYNYYDYDSFCQKERSDTDKARILDIFLSLVEVTPGNTPERDVRRRRTQLEITKGSSSVSRLIEDLCKARLLSKGSEQQGDAEVEVVNIIHESLLRNWSRLSNAIAERRTILQQRSRFEDALREWASHKHHADYLLTGIRLSEAIKLNKEQDITMHSELAQRLLRESVAANVNDQRLKSELISTVSHELRAPLTSILGYTELLLARAFSDKERRQFINTVYVEAGRLAQLVEDLLGISRLEMGKVEFNASTISLRQLLDEINRGFSSQLTNHALVVTMEDDIPPIYADRDKLKQIFFNLLTNAVKYSPKGGIIEITASKAKPEQLIPNHPDGTWVFVQVIDQGVGISAEDISRIWEKFYRVDNANTRRTGGTGLGLHITQALIELHGGRVWVDSVVGKGSTFSFTLPSTPLIMPIEHA